jgi:antirestriction protein ArdC
MQKVTLISPKDIYTRVTDRIIGLLEKGVIPWRKPWQPNGMPKNLISKRPYTGINSMLLNSLDYKQNYFLTHHQLQQIGGRVKKGEKGAFIIYATKYEKEEVKNGEIEMRQWTVLKSYTVFNVEQCSNIPEKYIKASQEPVEIITISCEQILQSMPLCPTIYYRGHEAYYSPKLDYINMPNVGYFESMASFYGVLFHELVHSTGALHRLARKSLYENAEFGSETYSLEELIAEIGSCYLTSIGGVGICDLANSAAYIQEWLSVLQNDKKFIVQAASKAQQAVDYILNVK